MNKHDLLINLAVERARLFHELLGVSASESGIGACVRRLVAARRAGAHHRLGTVRLRRSALPARPAAGPAQSETSDEDAYNAKAVAVWRTKPLQELLDTLAIAHRQLTVAVAGCSQAQLDFVTVVGDGR